MAAGFAVVNLVRFDDAASALLWAQWSVLWAAFFVVIALGRTRWTAVVGWLTLIQAFTTCTIPAFVYLLGGTVPAWAIAVSIVLTALVLAPGIRRTLAAGSDDEVAAVPQREPDLVTT